MIKCTEVFIYEKKGPVSAPAGEAPRVDNSSVSITLPCFVSSGIVQAQNPANSDAIHLVKPHQFYPVDEGVEKVDEQNIFVIPVPSPNFALGLSKREQDKTEHLALLQCMERTASDYPFDPVIITLGEFRYFIYPNDKKTPTPDGCVSFSHTEVRSLIEEFNAKWQDFSILCEDFSSAKFQPNIDIDLLSDEPTQGTGRMGTTTDLVNLYEQDRIAFDVLLAQVGEPRKWPDDMVKRIQSRGVQFVICPDNVAGIYAAQNFVVIPHSLLKWFLLFNPLLKYRKRLINPLAVQCWRGPFC